MAINLNQKPAVNSRARELLADILATLSNAARMAHDDAELQDTLTQVFGLSIEEQRNLAQIHPAMLQVAFIAKVLHVEVRGDYLARLQKVQAHQEAEAALINSLILAGATRELMAQWFGITPKTYAARRRMLGLPATPGRPKCHGHEDPTLIRKVLSAWKGSYGSPLPERFLQVAHSCDQSVATIYRILEQAGELQE